jgi:hypothetical protein
MRALMPGDNKLFGKRTPFGSLVSRAPQPNNEEKRYVTHAGEARNSTTEWKLREKLWRNRLIGSRPRVLYREATCRPLARPLGL